MAKLIMLVGPSYCGKSTMAEKLSVEEDAVIISSDQVRKEVYGDENVQANPQKVFRIVHDRVRAALTENKNVIYDATNLSCKRRIGFLKECSSWKVRVKKECIVVVATLGDIQKRMSQRKRYVPMEVVHRQLCNFQCPGYYEGWDNIRIINTSSVRESSSWIIEVAEAVVNMSHDNPHHQFTVGKHMEAAQNYAKEHFDGLPSHILFAIGLHDIGKYYTKKFCNGRGEPTAIAHFLGHQNFGAYMMLVAFADKDKAREAALLVQWHMEHYISEGSHLEKIYDYMKKEGLYEYLKILEESDKNAH